MNYKHIQKALITLGLSKIDAQVYIKLATKGPQKAEILAHTVRLKESSLNDSLKILIDKKIVTLIFQESDIFFALPLHQTLEILLNQQLKETDSIEQSKEEILASWTRIIHNSLSS